MNYVTTENSIDEIDEILRKSKGQIIFKHNNLNLPIDTGKYKNGYAQRIFSFCRNEIILKYSKKIIILLEKLSSTQYSEINSLLSELNAGGVNINLTNPIRISPKIKKCQIRIGSLPVFILEDDSKLKDNCEFSSQICKNDSRNFKPQFLLQYQEKIDLNEKFSKNDFNFLNSKYILCGKYNDDTIFDIISSGILTTIKQNKDIFDNNELLGLKRFCYNLKEIKKMVILSDKHKVLEQSYQNLMNCSLRSNEIHKNFGELYAAIKYSLYHPNSEIYLPITGQTSFFDFISIEQKRNDKYVIVKKIPIKIKPRGAATSFTALLNCLYFNEKHPLYKQIKTIIDNCPKNNSIIHKLKTIDKFDELEMAISNFYKSIDYNQDGRIYEYMKPIFKDIKIARKFWEYILPVIDIEKTKSKIEIGMVDTNGKVDFIEFNPKKVSICSPKRRYENVTALLTNKREKY
jgi:hypothetical protein